MTSALVSTLIQQWAREYLQYSQPTAAPHKRGRVRAYLFDGLSRFQMIRLTYGVPVLLHLAVFLFFYAISEWLHSINVPVGTTARYCLIALFAAYMALSVLPLIVRNSPYQTALTTPLQACVSFILFPYIVLCRLVGNSYYQSFELSHIFKGLFAGRALILIWKVQMLTRAPYLDRSAMQWLLQELNEDNMDTFLSGLPGYLQSPLTDKNVVVEGLIEDGIPRRILHHMTTCLSSVELSQEESLSRASTCINSLRLISEAVSETATPSRLKSGNVFEIMRYLWWFSMDSSTALRAWCIRGLVIGDLLFPFVDLDARRSGARHPNYLIPLHRVIGQWKTTDFGTLISPGYTFPIYEEAQHDMWQDVYDGPLINLAVLAYAILSRAQVDEGSVNFDMAWKTLETLLKSFGLAQVEASSLARKLFDEVLHKARDEVSKYNGEVTQIDPLLKTLDIVIRGLRLAKAFAYSQMPKPPRKQIEAIFGPEQLRNTELMEAFAAHLRGYVRCFNAGSPEVSQKYMEDLIMEDKLWEQLHFSLLKCFDPEVPFPDKLRIVMAFFDIFNVAFDVLKESTIIEWRSADISLLFHHCERFQRQVAPGEPFNKAFDFRSILFDSQYHHALLSQIAMQQSRGEPLMVKFPPSLSILVKGLGLGNQGDLDILAPRIRTPLDGVIKAGQIIDVILRDGPLSNFCILGRSSFDKMALDDLTSDDIKKLLKTLERMVDAPVPFTNSSEDAWTRFDKLYTIVRNPAKWGGDNETMERLQPLLNLIEKVKRIRPPADGRAEGMGNVDNQTHLDGSDGREAPPPGVAPIPGSSGQVEVSRPGDGGSMDPRLAPSVQASIPSAGMD